MPPGLPNGGIAQGSMLVVKGTNLGPSSFVVANSFPLPTSIGGTSVIVQIKGQTIPAIMYYAGAAQAAAILPSSTPTGTGTLKLTYNGRTASSSITVVQNGVGIFTVPQSGSGDAIATLGSSLVTASNSANAGDVVAFWGTGLGPVTSDETMPAQQQDMTNVPVQAYVGGQPANILFRGRNACCSSVDTIYIQIPAGITGCVVPVVFTINNVVSNTTTIPIAVNGRVCTPTNPAFSSANLSSILSSGSFSSGSITLTNEADTTQTTSTTTGGTFISDSANAVFLRQTVPASGAGIAAGLDIPAYGTCLTSAVFNPSGYVPVPAGQTYMDAGSRLELSGPVGAIPMNKATTGNYIFYNAALAANLNFFVPGRFTVAGTGGPDVGSFSASVALPPQLNWTNESAIATVALNSGVTVTWSGGDPGGYVQISGQSYVNPTGTTTIVASFQCTARTGDGTFTVPPIVLQVLPPSGNATLSVSGVSAPTAFQASGLTYAFINEAATSSEQVTYQ